MTTLRFFYNGIKENVKGAKLQKAWYGMYDNGDISISSKDYARFSAAVRATFEVKNNSDGTTDYFETDRIRVTKDHPLFAQVAEALISALNRRAVTA
jgi:hypothetical protein